VIAGVTTTPAFSLDPAPSALSPSLELPATNGSVAILKAPPAEEPYCINSVCFVRQATIDGQQFPLLGAGRLRYYGFQVYTAALYGPVLAQNGSAILRDVPKRFVIHYLRAFKIEDFINSSDTLLKENPQVNFAEIRPGLDLMNKLYHDVKPGDRYTLEYVPQRGLSLTLNDTLLGTVPGAAFGNAYLSMWLSDEHSLSDSLQPKLFVLAKGQS